jgi:hypothetical protein
MALISRRAITPTEARDVAAELASPPPPLKFAEQPTVGVMA